MTEKRNNSNLNPYFKTPEYNEISIILIMVAIAPSIRRICPNFCFSSPSDFKMGTTILKATVGSNNVKNIISILNNNFINMAKGMESNRDPK